MKKALVEIVRVSIGDGKIVNMSISDKQSNLGLSWNERLLVLIQNQAFGYFKSFKLTDEPSNIDIAKIKELIPIKNIIKDPTVQNEIIKINFFVLENGKQSPKQWVFRFKNISLAQQWSKLFKREKDKKFQSKSGRKSKIQAPKEPPKEAPKVQQNQNKSEEKLAPNKSLNRSKGHIPMAEVDNKSKVRLEKDIVKIKNTQNTKPPQQFTNDLYQTENPKQQVKNENIKEKKQQFILNDSLTENKQPEPKNIARKLDYIDDQTHKKINNQQQQRLRQQRELLKKKERQLAQKQKKIKQEQQRIEQQKRRIEEYNKQIAKNKEKQNNNQVIPKKDQYISGKNNQNKVLDFLDTSRQKQKQKQIQILQEKERAKERQRQRQRQREKEKERQKERQKEREKEREKEKPLAKNEDINEANGKGAVINQKFFLKNKQQPIKQQALTSGTQKPKLQGVNYSQIVNKVILTKSNQKPKVKNDEERNIEQKHDMLFEITKLKLKNEKNIEEQEQQKEKEQEISQLPKQADWTYKFLKSQTVNRQFEVINEFKEFCSNILKQVVEQFHLPQKKRNHLPKYKREQFYTYEVDGVEFKIAMIGLKQVYNKEENNRDQICDQKTVKMLEKQFRNYEMLYRVCKQLQTKLLKIPLCCLCQYQGCVAFFKAKSQFETQSQSKLNEKVNEEIQKVSEMLRINSSIMKNKQNFLILHLKTNFYKEIGVKNGLKQLYFDHFLPDQIGNLLPIDGLFNKSQSKQVANSYGPQLIQNNFNARSELLINMDLRQFHENICQQILVSLKKAYRIPKTGSTSNSKSEIDHNILISISYLIKQLDDLEFYFVTPKQLQRKMHENGINIRYLGLIYQHCALKFQKCYIMSQIAARVCKALFRKTIQDINVQDTQQILQNNYHDNIRIKIIDFLNCIMGSSIQTVTIWKVLSTHCIQYFNIPLIIQDIQKGYFINSLIHHCGIDVNWTHINISSAFVSNQFFNDDNYLGIKVKTKIYQPTFSQQQRILIYQLQSQDPNAIKILEQQYKLQTKALPEKFRHENYLDYFRKYLTNFVAPDYGIQRGYKLLSLYSSIDGFSTKNQFYLKFMELKWEIKRQRKEKYINAFSNINSQITTNFGDFHPLLSQLYDIMCIYHRNNGEYEDAITFSKSSVINMLKVCGANHPKVGESYFQLASCCIKGGKKQQAIISLQKAKNIFQANNLQGNLSYAHVCLKLGLLFLSESKTKQAQKIVHYALSLFNKHYSISVQNKSQINFEEERVQCFQILSRCYELDEQAQKQIDLSLQCQKLLHEIKSPQNLQKMLKIILSPLLGSLSPSDASAYLDFISQIPLQISVNTYLKGYQSINQRVNQETLVQNLQMYLLNIKTILSFITENNCLKKWNGLSQVYERGTVSDFISLTQELIYFLGQGFVTGSIRDSL